MSLFYKALSISSLTLALATPALAYEPESVSDDPLQIVVSLNEQRLQVYRGTEVIAESRVSSGKPGYSTPTGIFSILDKAVFHRSNIYSDAPMPFMQRLTWTGIALHGSDSVPDYPASHGCIRLPEGFDEELFEMTKTGAHVMVNGDMAIPRKVNGDALPNPSPVPGYDPYMDHWRIRFMNGSSLNESVVKRISTADMLLPVRDRIARKAGSDKPLRIMISRRTRLDQAKDIQRILNELGFDAGAVDGLVGRGTQAAIRRFEESRGMPITGTTSTEVVKALYRTSGLEEPPNALLSVRQNFEPLFEAPIHVDNPEQPLGTHLIVASGFDRQGGSVQWNSFTLENQIGDDSRAIQGIDMYSGSEVWIEDALSRIHLPRELKIRLSGLLTPGSSIVIADNGYHRYTGWKTDFAVSTDIYRRYLTMMDIPVSYDPPPRRVRERAYRPPQPVQVYRYNRPRRPLIPYFNGFFFAQ